MKFNLREINEICISVYSFKNSLSKDDKSYEDITNLYNKIRSFVKENEDQISANLHIQRTIEIRKED
jgi:DNA-binding ferritin-like protein